VKKTVILCFLASIFIFNLNANDEENSVKGKHETPGFAITAGYGYEYSGIGVAAERYFGPNIGMMLGVGYFPPVNLGGITTGDAFGVGGGFRFAYGNQHRVIGDVHFGFAGKATRTVTTTSGTTSESDTMWGPTLAIGYQFLHQKGFIVHASVGGTYLLIAEDWVKSMMGSIVLTLNLGIGYKF